MQQTLSPHKPVFTILAGSNGAGKSTMTAYGRVRFQGEPVLDPDAISVAIGSKGLGGNTDLEAGRLLLLRAEELLTQRQSFTVETTLSGSTYLRMAQRAKHAGYRVVLMFLGTTSVEINLVRVKARVLRGGHDVPEVDQRRRYSRTLANVGRLLLIADSALLFDNSSDEGPRLVASGSPPHMDWHESLPNWAVGLKELLCRL